MFGWLDIKLRYRRSLLGPFWLTISVGVMVASMGVLYAQIFQQDIKDYLPFVACGVILWFFISSLMNEGCLAFTTAEYQIKQVSLPLAVYVLRLLWRSIIIFLHNALVIIFVVVLFKKYSFELIYFPFAFLLICILFFFYSMIMGIICARFRDIPQIILALTQLLMFITPIFWQKEFITKYTWVTDFNPVFHMLEILRAPLLGRVFPVHSLYVVLGITFGLMIISLILLKKYRNRVAYWV
jgi:ABC-type polysaccharide/polyol phosphate export permease